jgi:hypothetical protein
MDDFAERIKALLENPTGELWFPELTADLAALAWEHLRQDIGLTPDSYSTERVLSRSLDTPREIITSLKTGPYNFSSSSAIAVETLTQESSIQYHKQGISFYSAEEILGPTILSCIEDALDLINQVPSMMETVAVLVRSLHGLKPEDEDHDVSFSEPHVPFSVFVSVPEKRVANNALRVAEAIVHEAMHLQLTLIERKVDLSVAGSKRLFSPWRREFRGVQGILHALYVFRVIDQFLGTLISTESASSNLSHIESRRREIDLQVFTIRDFEHCQHLTKLGGAFVKNLTSYRGEYSFCHLIHSGNQHS